MNTYIDKLTFLLKKNENFYKLKYNDVKHIKKFEELLLTSIKHSSIEKRIICSNVEENNLFYKYSLIVYNFKLFNSFDWSKYNLKNLKKEDIFLKFINNNNNNNNNNNKIKNIKYNLNKVLKDNNITQLYVSKSLKQFENRFKKKYNLNDYNFKIKNTLFFGLYDQNDFEILKKHIGKKILILGGSDLENIKKIKNINNVILLSISKNIYERLYRLKIKSILVDFNLVNKNIFKPITNYGESIYLYDGFTKKNDNIEIYNTNLLNEVKKRLPQFKYIHSSDLNVKHELMNEVYKKCFIGLRLTKNDGNANTVQEFEAMNIPIIHNLSHYGIKWNNIDTIVNIILSKSKELKIDDKLQLQKELQKEKELQLQKEKELQLQKEKELQLQKDSIDFFETNKLDDNILKLVNNNINNFLNLIHNFKNILLICGDFPGYGGSSTNCSNLSDFLNKNNHNTFSIYFNYPDSNFKKYETNNNYLVDDQNNIDKRIKELKFKPDLIILKSPFHLNLKKYFNCDIYYLVGGIYKNCLNKNYRELTKEENNKFINQSVITQIKLSDKTFVNSSHTCNILLKNYNLKTYIFYSSFVPFINKKIITDKYFENRKYEYGLIVSDFSRNIKNIQKSIEFLKNKTKVVLIGKNSNIYKNYGFDCIDLIDKDKMDNYYKQIKYIIQDSFYESCSNVKIESLFNGCQIYNKKNKKYNVVVSSTQYPGYGGAATNAYQIIKFLRSNGINTVGVFFHNRLDVNYDPENIGGIFLYLTNKFKKDKVKSDVKSYLKVDPNYCLAKNYRAPYLCKELFNCYTVYLVSGINHFNLFYPKTSAIDFLSKSFIIDENKIIDEEIKTCKLCESIIVNSKLSYDIFKKIYPEFIYKLKPPLDTTFCIKQLNESYDKEYDIILICSNFTRESKNNLFLIDVLKNKLFNKYKKLIIGERSDLFKDIENVTLLPLQIHENCLKYMSKSKLLLHPAVYESNSNTIREAYYHKCLPMITRNVGYNELFPDYLICKNFSVNEWVNKIKYILDNYDNVKNTVINFNTGLDIDKLLLI